MTLLDLIIILVLALINREAALPLGFLIFTLIILIVARLVVGERFVIRRKEPT